MSDITADWPVIVDDTGAGQNGTVLDLALFNLIKTAINNQVYSSGNPSLTPKAIIDEVVTARGSKASLDARLDVSLEEDGTLKSQASLITATQLKTQVGVKNCWPDSLFYLWPDGDSSAPNGWTLTGSGAAVARCGSGGGSYEASAPADSTKMKYGRFAVKLTYGSATLKLTRTLIASGDFPDGLKAKKVSVGIRCKAGVASMASIVVDDGATQTRGGSTGNGTYHSGDNTEQWIYCTHTVSNSATKLDIYLEVAQSGSAYFGCGVLVRGDFPPEDWIPERWGYLTMGFQVRGTLATGTIVNEWRQPVPVACLLERVSLRVKTAPSTQAIIIDLNKNGSSSAYNSGSGRPQIAAAATSGVDARPDGTYASRIFKADDYITLDVDQVGSGTVGEELTACLRFIAPLPELDILGT